MSITIHDVMQGTEAWHDLRRGIITASAVGKLVTPKTVMPASNEVSRALTRLLVSERITGWTEDTYQSRDMLRGVLDEPLARDAYRRHYAPVDECGFISRDWDDGIRLGLSPDGLVGDDGLIEIKSRAPKEHLSAILADAVPLENIAQCQAALLTSGRQWLDYVSWCGGMPMWVKRVEPSQIWHTAILEAARLFERAAAEMIGSYHEAIADFPLTERTDHFADLEV